MCNRWVKYNGLRECIYLENNRSKENAARYANVYNKILQMIKEGMYPEGSKLQSEPVLAEQMKHNFILELKMEK